MQARFTLDDTAARALLADLSPSPQNAAIRRAVVSAGEVGKLLILIRTARGFDWRGYRFKAYSKGYAAKRAKQGRQTNPVPLLYTGQMLASFTVSELRDRLGVSVGPATDEMAERLYENITLGRDPMGWRGDEQDKIAAQFIRTIGKEMGTS